MKLTLLSVANRRFLQWGRRHGGDSCGAPSTLPSCDRLRDCGTTSSPHPASAGVMPLSWFDADKTVEVDMFALSARLGFDDESEITRVFRVPPELLELARGEGSRRGRWQRGDWFSALARRRRWRMLLMVLVSSAGVLALRWIS